MSSDFPFIHKNLFIVKKNKKYMLSKKRKLYIYDSYETDYDNDVNSNDNYSSHSNPGSISTIEMSYVKNDIKRLRTMFTSILEYEIPNKYVDYIMTKQIESL